MTMNVDKTVLVGFIEEAKSYLPTIQQGIEAFQADPSQLDGLAEAHRYAHTIKGASSMVGIAGLSHIGTFVEEALEAIGADQLAMNDETMAWLSQAIVHIETYLDNILNDTFQEAPLVLEVTASYHELRGLPVEEAIAEVTQMLAQTSSASTTATSDVSLSAEEAFLFNDEIDEDDFDDDLEFDDDVEFDDEDDFDDDFEFDDEISPELLEAFFLEAEDHIRLVSLTLTDLEKSPDQKGLLQDIRRSIHTLKGAAGTVGLQTIAGLAHRMEDVLDGLYEGQLTLDSHTMELLFATVDTLEDMANSQLDADALQSAAEKLYDRYSVLLDGTTTTELVEQSDEEPLVDLSELVTSLQTADSSNQIQEALNSTSLTVSQEEGARRESGEVVRVPIEHLDSLIRLVSELVITQTTLEQRVGDFALDAEELRPSIERLRRVSSKLETEYEASALGSGLHALAAGSANVASVGSLSPLGSLAFTGTDQTHDFDELEFDRYTDFHLLSRELAEAISDVNTIGNAQRTLIGDFDSILRRQGRLSSELQEKLMRTRMVPLATLATRLHRAVRVVARKQDKLVGLVLEGEHIELDKTVLEEIADPLLHILRNAVDHGIEPPALRQALNKPEAALINLRAYHEGNQVVIQISDDGAGLDLDNLKAKAISDGYASESEVHQLSDEALYNLVFAPGFSTATEVSEVSGRGVGLDVVKTNVTRLKGTIALDSVAGQGVTFTIRLPMTLAVTRALLVKAHYETFAIPLNAVSQILRLEREEIEKLGQEPVIRVAGQVYPVLRLGQVLNLKQAPDDTVQRQPVLILNAGGQHVALIVDHIVQGREVVIKSLGSYMRQVHGVMGATLMGDGSLVLILNPAELVTAPTDLEARTWSPIQSHAHTTWSVMIVDDSVSVRRVVSNLVKNAGWQPITAKDGLEALEIIQHAAQLPDLILLDIEMPRMDGYELTATLRRQVAYQNIPIVMLTSRAGEKHRRKAFDLGVSEYLVKPYQDEVLLGIVRRLVQESR